MLLLYRPAVEHCLNFVWSEPRLTIREREEDVLQLVITLGFEHVLLIVKGPGLSPSLPVSQWSLLREEEKDEADWHSRHLTGLAPRHMPPSPRRPETAAVLSYVRRIFKNCMFA